MAAVAQLVLPWPEPDRGRVVHTRTGRHGTVIRSGGPAKTVVRFDGDPHLTAVFNTHLTPETHS